MYGAVVAGQWSALLTSVGDLSSNLSGGQLAKSVMLHFTGNWWLKLIWFNNENITT